MKAKTKIIMRRVPCSICAKPIDIRGLAAHERWHANQAGSLRKGKPQTRKPSPVHVRANHDVRETQLNPIAATGNWANCFHCGGLLLIRGNTVRHVATIADLGSILQPEEKPDPEIPLPTIPAMTV